MKDYLLKLFAHEEWANRQLIDEMQRRAELPSRLRELIPHMLSAHLFWTLRLTGGEGANFVWWPKFSGEECRRLNEEYARGWATFIGELPELVEEQSVTVASAKGEPVTFRVIDILTQLHSHSVHHRGQIAMLMHTAGFEVIPTDYIVYCRKHP
ncbi:hypothetical protein HZB60_09535 [candidate division KSB1 bacterium]|nr:hypothetical protein [candidate division KSB1 bacterium]